MKLSRGETDDPPICERIKSSARMAKRSRPNPVPEPPLKMVLPTGGAPEGNSMGESGWDFPPRSPDTIAVADAMVPKIPLRSELSNNRGWGPRTSIVLTV